MTLTSLQGKDLVHKPISIFKVPSQKKAQKSIQLLMASWMLFVLTRITSRIHSQGDSSLDEAGPFRLTRHACSAQLHLGHIPVSFLLPFPPSRLFFSTAFNIFNTPLLLKRRGGEGRGIKDYKLELNLHTDTKGNLSSNKQIT